MKRRHFLKISAAAALLRARESFAQELGTLSLAKTRESQFDRARDLYSLSPRVVYFNHASIGTVPRIVQDSRSRYAEVCEQNPWLYMWGGAWEEAREDVRAAASRILKCQPKECAITHNTTEAFNLLASGLPLGRGDEVVFSSLNHPGASLCWFHQAETKGFQVRRFVFPVDGVPNLSPDEVIDLYDRHITPRTAVLVLPDVDNQVGIRHPIREISRLAHERGVRFVAVDGAQSAGMLPLDVSGSGCDFYATSPHKWLQAPKGLGLLYVREQWIDDLRPMWVTWGQQRWKGTARIYEDYGTRNLPEALSLGDAIRFQESWGQENRLTRLASLRAYFRSRVRDSQKIVWRSADDPKLISFLYAVEVKGKSSEEVFAHLNREKGFVFRPFARPLNTLRISPNIANTTEEMDQFFDAVEKL